MKLYNTASRKIETFKPLGEVVKIYTCGPTVYSNAHIGNLTAYIYWDLLVRALRANKYKVKRVLNLTDVGHLVSDGDEGEDKLEKGAAREGRTVWEVADSYIEKFLDDYRSLELSEPEVIARATDYIDADMQAVDLMTERGFTYETRDGVYFDTAKFDDYAKFARLDIEGLQAGARVGFSSEKRGVADFAVWKFIQPGEKHAMRWDYLGRPGYPGWHLECSTIIHETLGEPIDIHTGGIDHIPVHHTNEIAQSYAAYGHELARVWMHCNFITIDGEKISKSLGNVYLLSDLAERGFTPIDYKMWVLSGHYQGARNFTFESLGAAKQRRLNWRNRIAALNQQDISSGGSCRTFSSPTSLTLSGGPPPGPSPARVTPSGHINEILNAVNDNLNSAEAFALIDNSELTLDDWRMVDELFGLRLIEDSPDVPDDVYELLRERDRMRAEKNYQRSDELRDLLLEKGYTVKDTPEGAIWQYAE